ncbi:MAG: hypothetical protein RLY87_813 [Chloroflexota bacterium]
MRRMPVPSGTFTAGMPMPHKPIALAIDARTASDHFPGIGRVVSALAHAWADNPRISRLHIFTNPARQNSYLRLPTPSERVIQHALHAVPGSFAEGQQLRRTANTLAVDWVYSPYLLLPWGRFHARTLVTVHDAIPLTMPQTAFQTRFAFLVALRIIAARATCLTTVSDAAAASITPFIWPHRAPTVVPNGVDERFFTPSADHSTYSTHMPYALCVSSNQPHKNLATLITAWQRLADAQTLGPRATLLIAGAINRTRAQPWLTAAHCRYPIIHLGSPSDAQLSALYQHAHLVVQPSVAEGYGLPVLEALASGAPVLCHDLPVYHTTAGAAVMARDLREPADIAAAIASLWYDAPRRAQLRHEGPIQARRADWNVSADALLDIMQKNTSCQ